MTKTEKRCAECLEHIDAKILELKEYCLGMISEEIKQAKIHAQSSRETLARFETEEKRVNALSERFDMFLKRFDEHLANKEKYIGVMNEKIDEISMKLDSHMNDESANMKNVIDAISKISPFVEEATKKKIAEDYLIERERRTDKIFKAKMGWAERALWFVASILALAGAYNFLRDIFV